jgi:hypothetical protein
VIWFPGRARHQAAQARDDFAMIMDELDFVKAQLARLPTRRDQAFTPLRIVATTAFSTAALVIIHLVRGLLATP